MASTPEPPPCISCKNLDLAHKTPAYRPGDFHTFVGVAAEAADSGSCPICSVLFTAAYIFAGDTDLFTYHCKLDVTLPSSPGQPLRLDCWEDGGVSVDFITTAPLSVPFSQFTPAPLIAPHSHSPQCFAQIHDWMAVCDASHDDCKAPASVKLPTRVVDVNPTPDGLRPVLVTTNGVSGQYAALSYSWGAGLPLKLTRSSLASFMSGIPWTDIPKTLQDAMTITHKLGLRYLWVDSLTIIQDDEDDWHTEAAKMAIVYGNAHVTIAATHSQDLDAGIFAPRDFPTRYYRVWPLPEQLTAKPSPVADLRDGEIYVRNGTRRSLDSHPLQKRGWALQEHILSRRVIQYASDELVFHCRTARATETDPKMKIPGRGGRVRMSFLDPVVLPPRSEIDPATRNFLSEYWSHVVQNYSNRKLTRESDKLVALSGVADALSASGMGPHHAGMFESDPLVGLAWYSHHTFPDGPWAPTHARPAHYRAPSWSWASLDGRVEWGSRSSGDPDYLRAPLAQCSVVRMSDTELVLRGKQIPGVLTQNSSYLPSTIGDESGGYQLGSSRLVIGESLIEDPYTDIIDTTPMHPGVAPPAGLPKLPLDVICLQLGFTTLADGRRWATALILTRSPKNAEAYERVGIDYRLDGRCFDGVEETEVTIL